MQIDWFTFLAQIVNFLILLVLLKRFLYGPIIKAMAQREATISNRLNDARIKLEEAEKESEEYHAKNVELEQKKQAMLEESREDANNYRKKLMHNAREEVDKIERDWREAIIREQKTFLHDLSQRVESQILAVARRMMRDLANVEIEQQAITVFFERMKELKEEEWNKISDMVKESDKKMVIKTRFEVQERWREKIKKIVKRQFGEEVEPHFEISSELGFGIEIRFGGRKLAWTLDSYMGMLQERISDALEETLEERIGEVINKKNSGKLVESRFDDETEQ
jgi:F-type H+-transporting ATPase subunit b